MILYTDHTLIFAKDNSTVTHTIINEKTWNNRSLIGKLN